MSDPTVAIWQEGKYWVVVHSKLDISSFGETRKEAEQNLQEAVELTLEDETS